MTEFNHLSSPKSSPRRMGITLAAAIGALVHAARLGLFDMSWNMLCPGCGGVLETAAALNTLNRDHYFCAFCVQENEPTLDQLVEVTFTVNPRIRRIGAHDPSTLSHAEYMRQIFWSSGAVVPEDIEGAIQRVTLDLMELQPGEKAAMSLTLPNGFRQDGGDERKGQRHPDRALALAFADGERLDGLGGIDQEFVEPTPLIGFLGRELIEAAVDKGVAVRPPQPDTEYYAFADPSGGVGDAFTAAVAHRNADGSCTCWASATC